MAATEGHIALFAANGDLGAARDNVPGAITPGDHGCFPAAMAHRDDFPDEGDLEASYFTKVRFEGDGSKTSDFEVTTDPVKFTIVKPGESLIDGEVGAPVAAE